MHRKKAKEYLNLSKTIDNEDIGGSTTFNSPHRSEDILYSPLELKLENDDYEQQHFRTDTRDYLRDSLLINDSTDLLKSSLLIMNNEGDGDVNESILPQ